MHDKKIVKHFGLAKIEPGMRKKSSDENYHFPPLKKHIYIVFWHFFKKVNNYLSCKNKSENTLSFIEDFPSAGKSGQEHPKTF